MQRSEELMALRWAHAFMAVNHVEGEGAWCAAKYVLENVTPQTMADTAWDPGRHRGAGATTLHGDDVVMIEQHSDTDIDVLVLGGNPYLDFYAAKELIPDGRMFQVTEVRRA